MLFVIGCCSRRRRSRHRRRSRRRCSRLQSPRLYTPYENESATSAESCGNSREFDD